MSIFQHFRLWLDNCWLELRSLYQRLTRGYTDRECWNLDISCARWLVPRLKGLKRMTIGYPAALAKKGQPWDVGMARWKSILDKMIIAFELIANQEFDDAKGQIKPEVKEGLALFHKYFLTLWV